MPSPYNFSKTYIYLRNHTYRPDNYIKLGQPLKDPTAPWELRLGQPLPLSKAPETSTDAEFVAKNTITTSFKAGALAQILDFVDASIEASKSDEEVLTYSAARVETVYFEPTHDEDFVAKINASPKLKKWLKKYRLLPWKCGYIITGLKIARKPTEFKFKASRKATIAAEIKATLDPQGVVSAGVNVDSENETAGEVSARPLDDFILAYQLRKISANWRTAAPKIGAQDGHGDLFGQNDDNDNAGEGPDARYALEESSGEESEGDEEEDGEEEGENPDPDFVGLGVGGDDFGSELPDTFFEREEIVDSKGNKYVLVSTKMD